MSPIDKKLLNNLLVDARLSFNERGAIRDLIRENEKLTSEKSWLNPYSRAIAVLEAQSRAFEGSYG